MDDRPAPAAPPSRHRQRRTALWWLASLGIHGFLLGAALLFLPPGQPLQPTPDESIAVEVLTASEFAALNAARNVPPLVAPAPDALQLPGADALPSQPEPPPGPPAMVRATRMMSEKSLADPRSRLARNMLPHLADDERMEQVCGLEAMDQIQAWRTTFHPDRVVSYAMADTRLAENTLVADGAAFRSQRNWYNLKYRCALDAAGKKVVAFEFLVGEAIPRAEWEEHNLSAVN